jgi:hypothetical protein
LPIEITKIAVGRRSANPGSGGALFFTKPLDDEAVLGAVREALGIDKEETS